MPVSAVFASALSWGLVAAIVHVSVVLFRVHVLHGFTMTTQYFALASPLAYVAVFCLLAVPLALTTHRVRPATGVRLVTAFFAGLAALSALLLYRGIHPLAFVVLSIGMGWQVGLWFSTHDAARRILTRRVAPVIAGLLAVTGTTPLALSAWRERTAIGEARTAAEGSPNVLLLILDTVRAANLGAYGYGRATSPVMDSLAGEGTLFEHAYSTASWSLPAHASMLTGLWGHETGGNYLRRPYDSLRTFVEVLRDRGYVTGAFIGNAGWAGHETGFPRGFLRFTTYRMDWSQLLWSTTLTTSRLGRGLIAGLSARSPGQFLGALIGLNLPPPTVVTANLRPADEIASNFLAWHDGIGNRHPWFAMLNLFDAHDPYRSPFDQRFNGGRSPVDRYDGSIAWLDATIGRIVSDLRARGELDGTLLIVTSDHGEKFGEHGEFAHSGGLYLPVVHVPLLVRFPPRFAPGTRRPDLVSLADIPATILDVAGAADAGLPGQSLARVPDPGAGAAPVLFLSNRRINTGDSDRTSHGDVFGILTDEWHLIRFATGDEELYRWREDPQEGTNLAHTAEGAAVLPELRQALSASRRHGAG